MKKLAVILVIISSISITAAELRIKDKAEDLTVQEKTEEKYIYLEEKSPPIIGDPELNCIAAQKMCIINGFKVDGKIPNEAELQDLKMIVKMLNFAIPDGGIINVTGHTDSTGSEIYNKKLSTERAKNIAVLLRKFGLKDTVRIGSITGQGSVQPVKTNDTAEGRYQNRRVELFFDKADFSKANVKFIN